VRRPVALLAASLALTEPALAQTALAQTAPAETSAAVSTLLRQTERWLAQNRADLAASSITRALAADPGNADALLLAARVETTRGNRDAALGHLRRAQSSATSDTQRSAASAALRGSTLDPVGLEQARRLARDGRADEAAARYRALFGADGPSPDYAREYYQALSSGAGTRARSLAARAARSGRRSARHASAATTRFRKSSSAARSCWCRWSRRNAAPRAPRSPLISRSPGVIRC
jgi:tetratricopeptide (TPR) repeat protein